MLHLEYKEIIQALKALYSAKQLLLKVYSQVKDGRIMALFVQEDLATAWYRVNVCRLFTETDVNFEDCLQSSMGLIVDAKEMVGSLVAWGKGVSRAGQANILLCIRQAGDEIFTIIERLESMLNVCSSPDQKC
jgi:hypothetical protein